MQEHDRRILHPNVKILTGQRFGRWIVLAHAGRRGSHAAWRCRCVCGYEAVVKGCTLRSGASLGCRTCAQLAAREPCTCHPEKKNYAWGLCQVCYNRRLRYGRSEGLAEACELCGSTKRLCVDHDHATGRIRGVLCWPHNVLLGYAADDPAILRRAATYLEERRHVGA
jgi:hypothetical protein